MICNALHTEPFGAEGDLGPRGTPDLDAGEDAALEMAIEAFGNLTPSHGRIIDQLPLGQSLLFEVDMLLEKPVFLQLMKGLAIWPRASKGSPSGWTNVSHICQDNW